MKNVFKRFDRRVTEDIKAQRKTIIKGLICVAVTALLTSLTIPITKVSFEAIAEAGSGVSTPNSLPVFGQAIPSDSSDQDITRLAEKLGRPKEEVLRAWREVKAGPQSKALPDDARRNAVTRLGWLCLLVVGMFSIKYWFTRGQSYYLSEAAATLAADLRIRLYRKLQRLPITYFNERRTGAIQSVLNNDVNVYQNAIGIIRDSIDAPFKAITALIWMFVIQWQLALISAMFVPLMALLIQHNGRRMRRAQTKVQDDLSNLSAVTQEGIAGVKVIKAFAAEERVEASYRTLVNAWLKSQLAAARRLATLRPMVELLGAAALAITLYICGHLAYSGSLLVADIVALTLAMDVVNQGFRSLGYVNTTYNQVQAAAERIYNEVLDVPEEHAEVSGSRTPERIAGKIEFENVRFTYPDGTSALNGVSLSIEPGTSLALVGPSGAGKSTIADLLLRFYDPTEGRILFDDADIRELDLNWFRSQIGVVPQHTFLFAGTIAENIRLGNPDAGEDEIEAAARAAHADTFIKNMPSRYLTELGERGVRVSGGEMQRIAIARAIVRRPPALILDEATSNLDPVSEKAVQEALVDVMRGRTTLFIAHRLTTAARADRILVLRRGEIVESGSHKELLELDGAYAGMYRAFGSGVLDDLA